MTLGYRELLFAEMPADFKKLAKSTHLQIPLPSPKAQPLGARAPLAEVLQDPDFKKGVLGKETIKISSGKPLLPSHESPRCPIVDSS